MPLTPFHVGPPGLLSLWGPRRVEPLATALGAVLADIDFLLYLALGWQVHGALHTLAGAIGLGLATVACLQALDRQAAIVRAIFRIEIVTSPSSMLLGAMLGTLSHVLLDAMVYEEMTPLWPLLGNPLYLAGQYPPMRQLVLGVAIAATVLATLFYNERYGGD